MSEATAAERAEAILQGYMVPKYVHEVSTCLSVDGYVDVCA